MESRLARTLTNHPEWWDEDTPLCDTLERVARHAGAVDEVMSSGDVFPDIRGAHQRMFAPVVRFLRTVLSAEDLADRLKWYLASSIDPQRLRRVHKACSAAHRRVIADAAHALHAKVDAEKLTAKAVASAVAASSADADEMARLVFALDTAVSNAENTFLLDMQA